MRMMSRILAGAASFAALAAAAPSAGQYYGYQNNTYANSYGNGYNGYNNGYSRHNGYSRYNGYNRGYSGYAMNTSVATQQCTAAVQNRLATRRGLAGVIGSLIGAYGTTPRVLSITSARPSGYGMRVHGLASSGRYANSGYGGYASQADLSFRCDVDNNGYVRDVSINRR